uniref:(northern house mosquito) hypothetical protein n=1 Tax=Culex pipiens TaxID=7175 RepID=A0A8D8G5E0_CULPI
MVSPTSSAPLVSIVMAAADVCAVVVGLNSEWPIRVGTALELVCWVSRASGGLWVSRLLRAVSVRIMFDSVGLQLTSPRWVVYTLTTCIVPPFAKLVPGIVVYCVVVPGTTPPCTCTLPTSKLPGVR